MSPLAAAGGEIQHRFGSATDIERHQLARHALEAQVDERTVALAHANDLQQELLHRLSRSQEDERRRIARELHDSPGQSLTALKVALRELDDIIAAPPDSGTTVPDLVPAPALPLVCAMAAPPATILLAVKWVHGNRVDAVIRQRRDPGRGMRDEVPRDVRPGTAVAASLSRTTGGAGPGPRQTRRGQSSPGANMSDNQQQGQGNDASSSGSQAGQQGGSQQDQSGRSGQSH